MKAKFMSILCLHSLYRLGWRWNQNDCEAIVSPTLFSGKKDIQCADFCIQISFRMFLKFGDITLFLKILLLSGRWACSHSKWSSFTIKLKLRRIQCPVDVKFYGNSPNLQWVAVSSHLVRWPSESGHRYQVSCTRVVRGWNVLTLFYNCKREEKSRDGKCGKRKLNWTKIRK